MDKRTILIIVFGIIILILLIVFALPKITTAYKMEGFQQGVTICQQQVANTLLGDLNARGYTRITVGNKIITLGVIPPETQIQEAQQEGGEE